MKLRATLRNHINDLIWPELDPNRTGLGSGRACVSIGAELKVAWYKFIFCPLVGVSKFWTGLGGPDLDIQASFQLLTRLLISALLPVIHNIFTKTIGAEKKHDIFNKLSFHIIIDIMESLVETAWTFYMLQASMQGNFDKT